MSEVKYRVYDTKSGQILPVADIYNIQSATRRTIRVIGKVPMAWKTYSTVTDRLIGQRGILIQYTGRKDKDGTEIYEEDILKDSAGNITVVEWISGEWGYRHLMNADRTQVIGNRLQNPELLDV